MNKEIADANNKKCCKSKETWQVLHKKKTTMLSILIANNPTLSAQLCQQEAELKSSTVNLAAEKSTASEKECFVATKLKLKKQ